MDNVSSYFVFLTHNWKKIVLNSKNPNLTESEAQELVWKEFKNKQSKVKEVPSFELKNPILDKMRKIKEVHLDKTNNNQESAIKSVPILETVHLSKSVLSSESVHPLGSRELLPARRKSFNPQFLTPEPTTSRKTKTTFKTPNLKMDIVSKQYPFCSILMKESNTKVGPPAISLAPSCNVGAFVPRASSLMKSLSPAPGDDISVTMSPPGGTMSPPSGTMPTTGDTMSPPGGTMPPLGDTMSIPCGIILPQGGTMYSPLPLDELSLPRDISTSHTGGVVSLPKDVTGVDSRSSADKDEDFKCQKCNKQYKQISSFQAHECFKKLVKIPCPSCSKLISKTNMSHHLKLHSVTKFNCTQCKKVFRAKEKLKKHTNSHGVVRESVCEICGKIFRRPNHLKAHVKLHIDGDVATDNTSEVDAHRKMFTCKLCDQQFESGSGLKLHQKKNHPDASTKCDYCSKTFFSARGMRDHVKIHKQMQSQIVEVETETKELQTIEIVESEDAIVVDGLIHMEDININSLVFSLQDEEFNRVIEQYE